MPKGMKDKIILHEAGIINVKLKNSYQINTLQQKNKIKYKEMYNKLAMTTQDRLDNLIFLVVLMNVSQ